MAKQEQGNTYIDVNARSVSPAGNNQMNFTGLIKAGSKLVERKIEDNSAALLASSIDSYRVGIADLRNSVGDTFGDADIDRYNTMTKQDLSMAMLQNGSSVKDVNSAMTALKSSMESSDQYEVTKVGGLIQQTDGNGNATLKADPNYASMLEERAIGELGLGTQVSLEKMRAEDPTVWEETRISLLKKQASLETYNRDAQFLLAQKESIQNKRELTTEESHFAIGKAKRDVMGIFMNHSEGVLTQVREGRVTPEQAKDLIMDTYNSVMMSDGFTATMESYGQNAYDIMTSTRSMVLENVNLQIKAADPNVELTRELATADMKSKLFEANFFNAMPENTKGKLAFINKFEQIATADIVVNALSSDDYARVLFNNNKSMRDLTPYLEKGWAPDATKENFLGMMNYTEKAFIGAISSYGEVDNKGEELPTIMPEDLIALMKHSIAHPKYTEYTTPEQREKHVKLLSLLRPLYQKDKRTTRFMDMLIKEKLSEYENLYSF